MILKKVSAILGPTNTGKTFFAVEKMLTYQTGIIGFPLRLLARENYELIGKKIGKSQVALITGEEKIIPDSARYFFCTVESMPNKKFDFLAIDEVQLASNTERGYLFTEKILNARGTIETLFLGSLSIENLLKKIFKNIKIIKKPRLSALKYYGYKNLTRLPPRSAIIAFSQIDVYEIAEKIKKFQGGVSIVTGALSPEVRNAQVDLFERGEVNFIVATDAIGLGLNLDIKYLFFTSLVKFDGIKRRYLTYDEVAQIAGRAGRYSNDGFFGVTQNLKNLDSDLIKFVEDYEFNVIEKIYWRNFFLNFSSIKNLIKSLNLKPDKSFFIQKKDSSDINYLNLILQQKKIVENIKSEKDIRTLWEICGIPDYTKTFDDFHVRLLSKIINFLLSSDRLIPESWINTQVKQIKKVPDKISVINMKISQIRTWSYIVFKKNWLRDPKEYQRKIKRIEDFLSDKLHKNLINRFVESSIARPNRLISDSKLNLITISENQLFFNKKKIGIVKGLKFFLSENDFLIKKKSYTYKFIKNAFLNICKDLLNNFKYSDFKKFSFSNDGKILWNKEEVGFFSKGANILFPKVNILVDNHFSHIDKSFIKNKIEDYYKLILRKKIRHFTELLKGSNDTLFSSSYRAICFSLYENMGHLLKKESNFYYKSLSKKEIENLKKLKVKNGNNFLYVDDVDNETMKVKQMLIHVYNAIEINEVFFQRLIPLKKLDKNRIDLSIKIMNKLGYYKIKVLKEHYFIYFKFYEQLLNSIYYSKKKKTSYSKNILKECKNNSDFLKNCYKNPKILFIQ